MASRLLSYFRASAVAFPLAALAALAMFAISEASYQRATGSLDRLAERGLARTHLNTVFKGLLDAESAQRGYLITGRPAYLQPFQDGLAAMATSMTWLRNYYGTSPETVSTFKALDLAVAGKVGEMEATIRKRGVEPPSSSWRDLVLADYGREQMQAVRQLTERLSGDELEHGIMLRSGIYQTLLVSRIGVTAMAALSLLALFMYLRQSAALEGAKEVQSRRVATERDRLEREVTSRTDQLRALARHLQTVREDERSLLARELHDELGALLTAAKLDAARLKSRLGTAQPEALERLAHLTETLNGGIALKRRIIEDLRPSSLSNLGLVAALEILLREFGDRSEIEIKSRLEDVTLTPALQLTVYRLVQEALTNIAKYARADTIEVDLVAAEDGTAKVRVRDDGIGFDPTVATMTHGLLGMRFRVEAEGGTMRIDSAPGRGTTIEALLPTLAVPAPSEAAADAARGDDDAPIRRRAA